MIDIDKLSTLPPGTMRRKIALCLGAIERDILGIKEPTYAYDLRGIKRKDYLKALIMQVLKDEKLPENAKQELRQTLSEPFDERVSCNKARNFLLQIIGTPPAEWDLVIAPHSKEASRKFFPNVCVYAEDIRSPFNLGSIFRTAEAFGVEKVYLSPLCTDPLQKRALRSSMGTIDILKYQRLDLEELPHDIPIFALETGGTPISDFHFPREGIVILGSEELGISPKALKCATAGLVSIQMTGQKASLNVGVAFGILMQKWVESLCYSC